MQRLYRFHPKHREVQFARGIALPAQTAVDPRRLFRRLRSKLARDPDETPWSSRGVASRGSRAYYGRACRTNLFKPSRALVNPQSDPNPLRRNIGGCCCDHRHRVSLAGGTRPGGRNTLTPPTCRRDTRPHELSSHGQCSCTNARPLRCRVRRDRLPGAGPCVDDVRRRHRG